MTLYDLGRRLDGELHTGDLMRSIYATDASAYQETPSAVAIPRSERDLCELIRFARREKIGLIPRTAGTSLAGQVVGNGIVVDVSRHFTKILEINAEHPLLQRLDGEQDEDRFGDLSRVLLDQALLAEGGQLEDPAAFVQRLNKLMLSLAGGAA